jgi:hypothetical protein
LASPQGTITHQQTQQELQQILQQEAELEQLRREDEEQVTPELYYEHLFCMMLLSVVI